MWSLRWHFTNKSVTGAPYSSKSCSLAGHYGEEYNDWNMQCRLEVVAEPQPRWRRTNRRWKSIPRSCSSHQEGSITQRGEASSFTRQYLVYIIADVAVTGWCRAHWHVVVVSGSVVVISRPAAATGQKHIHSLRLHLSVRSVQPSSLPSIHLPLTLSFHT